MRETLTISLTPDLSKELKALVKRTGKSRSEIVRDALRRQIAVERFRSLRERLLHKAQAAGLYTDEDVFRQIS